MMTEQWRRSAYAVRSRRWSGARGEAGATNEHQIYFETQWGADNIYGHFPFVFPAEGGSRWGRSTASGTRAWGQREDSAPAHRELMDKYRKSFSVKGSGRNKDGQGGWKIALDEMWMIPIVSNSPASQGVRVIKTNMGTSPSGSGTARSADNPTSSLRRLVLQVLDHPHPASP